MEPTFIQWLVSQTGLAGIAALALWLNNRQAQDAIRRERENADSIRTVNGELLRTLQDNTKALAALEAAIERVTDDRPRGANRSG